MQYQASQIRLNIPTRLQHAVPSKLDQTNQTAQGSARQIKPDKTDQPDCNMQYHANQTRPIRLQHEVPSKSNQIIRATRQYQASQIRLNRPARLQPAVPCESNQTKHTNQIATGSTKHTKPDRTYQPDCNRQYQADQTRPNIPTRPQHTVPGRSNQTE